MACHTTGKHDTPCRSFMTNDRLISTKTPLRGQQPEISPDSCPQTLMTNGWFKRHSKCQVLGEANVACGTRRSVKHV